MLMVDQKGKAEEVVKVKNEQLTLFSDAGIRNGILSYLLPELEEVPVSQDSFCFFPSFFLVTWAKKKKQNTMCNGSYLKMLLGCKIFPALDGVRAFT